ncbi:MAG: isoprenylcysteine carboxylmethyltransferase family protein [Methanosarcinaceae archaeon]|nr:isoprenylcysteine carboxylmethyltransferase family protein [Methanosarcinaceae archaeon]
MDNKTILWADFLPMTFIALFFILQILMGIYLLSFISQNEVLAYIGVGLYSFSGLVFGMLPVFEFRRKGEVMEGKSYVNTTKLVETGLYSIVRHPQYLTWMLWAFAGILLFQHWIVILLGIPIIPLTYLDMMREDRCMIEKFGEGYERYMKRVPRANFILGIIRSMTKEN